MRLIAPMVPHVAEEAWAAAGHEGLVADAAWPVVDPAVLVEDEVTIAIQINGKLRDTLTLPKGTERADIEAAALASRSEEHTSELQSLMRISYAVFCLKKKNNT